MTKDWRQVVTVDSAAIYVITVQGSLTPSWSNRLAGMSIEPVSNAETPMVRLSGLLADQAALHGVMRLLHDLSLPILSVQILDQPADRAESG